MQLKYALLAERAERFQDGRLCIFGAEIEGLEVASVPFPITASLVVSFSIAPDEPLEGHTMSVEIENPKGETVVVLKSLKINTKRNEIDASFPSGANILVQIGIMLLSFGRYTLKILGDGKECARIPLTITASKENNNDIPEPASGHVRN